MTVTYPNGATVQALLLSSEGDTYRVAVPGEEDIRVFTRVRGQWQTEAGQPVNISFCWQQDRSAKTSEESYFVCSKELGRQLISKLMDGSEIPSEGPAPFYVFAAEKRGMRITVLRSEQQKAI